jgi:hypothetical protein
VFLLVQALLACVPVEPAPESPRHSRLSDTLEVEVNPGVNGAGGAWSATLRPLRPGEDPDARDPLPADTCVGTTDAPPPARATLPTRWTSVETEGALAGRWSRAGNGWTGHGTVRDPAWAVADLVLHAADAPRSVVTGAIRLGPTPAVTAVLRTPEGGARIAWDPRTVDVVRVRTRGPAGAMVCGARADGATLPWWAAPPRGGHLQVESTRQRVVRLDDGTLRLVRTVVVQDVAMDAPTRAREEDERVAVPVRRPSLPRRPQVRARGTSGTG